MAQDLFLVKTIGNVELYKHFTKLFEKASMIGIPQFYHMSNRPKDNYEIKILLISS